MNRTNLIFITMAMALSACTLGTDQSPLEGHASFRVDSVGGDVVDQSVVPAWDIPLERRLNLHACIKNLSGRDDITNHPFEISGDGRVFSSKTDSDGCAHWTETLGFDYLAKPTFVNLQRTIKSLGKQRGSVKFNIYVNPWAGHLGSDPGVVDPKRGTVTRLAEVDANFTALKAQRVAATELEIETVSYRLDMNSPSRTQDASVHLEFKPALVLKDMSGTTDRQPLEKGSFQVTAYLLRIDAGGEKTLIHKAFEPVTVELKNGIATLDKGVKFEDVKLDAQKSYALGLVVVPVGAPSYIADYRRVYDIPSFSGLAGSTLNLSAESKELGFDFQKYLAGTRNLTEPAVPEKGGGFFVVGRVSGSNNGIVDESMMQRRVKLSLNADVRWASTLAPLQGRKFRIYSMQPGADGNKRIITPKDVSDFNGTIFWEDEVVHTMYKKQERLVFEVKIEDIETGRSVTKCIKTNPWDFWATFFRDCGETTESNVPPDQVLVSSVPKLPLLKVDGLCMARTDSAISDDDILSMIQPDLSLVTKHRYNLQLAASILRYDDLRTGLQTPAEAMRGGWWLMSIAVYRNSPALGRVGDLGPNGELQPVATIEKAICNPGTSPAAEIQVALKDLALMDRNNYVAIQLKPLDQRKLKFTDAVGAVGPGASCSGQTVAPESELVLDTDNDLISPPYIFPMNLRNGGCPIVISHNNFEDPRLQALQAQLNRRDVHAVHEDFSRAQAAEAQAAAAQLQTEVTKGWKSYGESLGLIAHRILDIQDLNRALPSSGISDHRKMFDTLACLDQNFWADRVHQAQCTLNPEVMAIAKQLCLKTAALNADGTSCDNPLENFLVEEKMHVYGISEANYGGGFSTSLSVSNGFALGSFNGSDFGNALTDSATAGAAVGAGLEKGPVSGGVEGSLSKSWSSFNINFTREWTDNQVGVGVSASLVVENADINMKVSKYRKCYVLTTRFTRTKGYYLCGDYEDRAPEWRQERYFAIFNPGFNGSILNSNDERNRWLMQFRGERFYYHLMSSLNHNFAPYNIDGISVSMSDILKRTYVLYADRVGWGDPYVSSTTAPGQDQFVRIEGSERSLPVLGFNPFTDFGNQKFRDQNDPNLRVHDHETNFQ